MNANKAKKSLFAVARPTLEKLLFCYSIIKILKNDRPMFFHFKVGWNFLALSWNMQTARYNIVIFHIVWRGQASEKTNLNRPTLIFFFRPNSCKKQEYLKDIHSPMMCYAQCPSFLSVHWIKHTYMTKLWHTSEHI